MLRPYSWAPRVRRLKESRTLFAALSAMVLSLALFARTLRAGEGLPYLHKWGEPNLAGRSLRMLKSGDWNPHWFAYGSPTLYLCTAVDALHALRLFGLPDGHPEALRSLSEIETQFPDDWGETGRMHWRWTISHPSFYRANRLAMALLGTGTVALTLLVGTLLRGRWTGLLPRKKVVAELGSQPTLLHIRSGDPGVRISLP